MQLGLVRIGHFRQITRYNSQTSTVASVVNFGRKFLTLGVHLCLQHVCRDAACRERSSATADTYFVVLFITFSVTLRVCLSCY